MYILFSKKDFKWYIGSTGKPLQQRVAAHVAGRVKSTKHRRPLTVAYYESFDTFSMARKREWHLKHPIGYIEKLSITTMLKENEGSWPISGASHVKMKERASSSGG